MSLEKIWDHPTKQQAKNQIEEDLLEDAENKEIVAALSSENNKNKAFDFQETRDILEDVDKDDLYSWYSGAMLRRHRKPLQKESFNSHFFKSRNSDETFAYGEEEKGYLLGFDKFGVFTPTHFAPKTLRGGYELLRSLGASDEIPVILAITEDLADTLKKIPSWHKLEIKKEILSYFRGELVKKEIYYNSHPEVQNLMLGLLVEYMNKNNEDNDEDYNLDDFIDSDK